MKNNQIPHPQICCCPSHKWPLHSFHLNKGHVLQSCPDSSPSHISHAIISESCTLTFKIYPESSHITALLEILPIFLTWIQCLTLSPLLSPASLISARIQEPFKTAHPAQVKAVPGFPILLRATESSQWPGHLPSWPISHLLISAFCSCNSGLPAVPGTSQSFYPGCFLFLECSPRYPQDSFRSLYNVTLLEKPSLISSIK